MSSLTQRKPKTAEQKQAEAIAKGPVDPDVHHEYEFGGTFGTGSMMVFFPCLLYYLWGCLVLYDGKLQAPSSLGDCGSWLRNFSQIVFEHAAPTPKGAQIYLGLMAFQLFLAIVLPGYQQIGLPIESLNGRRLLYNCNALGAFYITMITVAVLHFTNVFRLSELIDHFGPVMSVAIIVSFVISTVCYLGTVLFGKPIRMSGSPIYDYFMGASLNPRILGVDIKMWAEVRIPWVWLFLMSIGGCIKQHDTYGYVSPNQAFMVLASGLQINACAKGEELIVQTWDMAYEKFGWLLAFWNFAGVPFTYCYSIIWMATHDPETYRFSTTTYVLLYGVHLAAHYIFDTAMAQKSHFKMQMDGGHHEPRWTFPQLPWNTVNNPKYIQTAQGGKLLIDGWWAYLRKPNYAADIVQVMTWGLCAGFGTPLNFWYPFFFFIMICHRCGRDFARCERKYGKDWDRYCEIVPYRFVPYIY